jgi:hypothetical protein
MFAVLGKDAVSTAIFLIEQSHLLLSKSTVLPRRIRSKASAYHILKRAMFHTIMQVNKIESCAGTMKYTKLKKGSNFRLGIGLVLIRVRWEKTAVYSNTFRG